MVCSIGDRERQRLTFYGHVLDHVIQNDWDWFELFHRLAPLNQWSDGEGLCLAGIVPKPRCQYHTKLLDVSQFSYNLHQNESTNQRMFEIVMDQQPLTPSAVTMGYAGQSLVAYKFVKGWPEQVDFVLFAKRLKNKRRNEQFDVVDLVMENYIRSFNTRTCITDY